ncbi:hypothetical protein, partial [Pseudoalteromonas sp. SIMBA_162]|uniref:hypothetical protein n=1 Tax=Pseudoalteromonas sp. SIMBA_162 TaxID=3080867 RepID=UPI00397D8537
CGSHFLVHDIPSYLVVLVIPTEVVQLMCQQRRQSHETSVPCVAIVQSKGNLDIVLNISRTKYAQSKICQPAFGTKQVNL